MGHQRYSYRVLRHTTKQSQEPFKKEILLCSIIRKKREPSILLTKKNIWVNEKTTKTPPRTKAFKDIHEALKNQIHVAIITT